MPANSTTDTLTETQIYSGPKTAFEITTSILGQLETGIQTLSAEQYSTAKDSEKSQNSPIGGHVRHVIEFYQALLTAIETPENRELSYDKRKRNLLFEKDQDAALSEIATIKTKIASLPEEDTELTLSSIVDPGQPMFAMRTTLYRELVYLLDHMIHHMALIKLLAKEHGVSLAENFGLAQSTKAHQTKPAK